MAVTTLALGYNSTIELDTGANDGTFAGATALGGWTTGTLTITRTNPDSTNVDTGGYQGREYGIKGIALAVDNLDDQLNDTAQDQLLADFEAGTKRWLRVRPRIGTGYVEWEFRAVINSVAYTEEQGGIVRFNLSCESDGTYTKQDQT